MRIRENIPEVDQVLDGARTHALVNASAEDLIEALPEQSIDLLLTDPPYCSGGMVRGDRANGSRAVKKYWHERGDQQPLEILGDTRDQRGYLMWASAWLRGCLRVLRPGSIAAVFTDWRQLPTVTDALQVAGYVWRGIIPWRKGRAVHGQPGRPRPECEYIVWGTAGPRAVEGLVAPGSYFDLPTPQAERIMVCSKPITLLQQLAELAPVGGVVLDPFAGGATTLIGAVAAGRRAIGAELSTENFELARRRVAGHLGEPEPLAA